MQVSSDTAPSWSKYWKPHEQTALSNLAREVLRTESKAVLSLTERINDAFLDAVYTLLHTTGKAILSGIGKSGHIARKTAATLSSTGTSAFFVHPVEAGHGDLGMITPSDTVIIFSNSGETPELINIMPAIKRIGVRIIALTGNNQSTLASLSDIHLNTYVVQEADPLGLAPTSSTAAQLAMGDALAVTLLKARGFGPQDFARSHPHGALGARNLTRVRDIMRTGNAIPLVLPEDSLQNAIQEMSKKRMGMTSVVASKEDPRVLGIFTDGDLRRIIEKSSDDYQQLSVRQVMTAHPHTIKQTMLLAEALHLIESQQITQLLVIDDHEHLIGALNTHDLLRAHIV